MTKQAAVMQLADMAARKARKAIDALAAGLEHFGSKMSGISSQAATLADQLGQEFSQITGERSIGQLQTFNPFENPSAATGSTN